MALSAKHFAFLFLLALLSVKLTQARQSQFFSKVAATTTTTTVMPSTNAKDTVQVPDDQPNFIQDSQTGYGLYDHSTGQLPPYSYTSKTPTSFPYTAAGVQPNTGGTERLMDQGYPTTTYNDDSNNNNEYMNEQQGLSGMSLVDMDPSSPTAYNNQAYVAKPDEYRASKNGFYKYATEQQGFSGTNYINNQAYVTKPEGYRDSNNNNNYNKYVDEQQGSSGTSLMDHGSSNQAYVSNPYGYESTNMNNNNYNYNNNGVNTYNSQQDQGEVFGEEKYLGEYSNNKNTNYYNRVNNAAGYNGQKQGMSDTRFMENGRYYYDPKNEYNYNPNGYSGSNINGNSMEGYQNQVSGDGFNP